MIGEDSMSISRRDFLLGSAFLCLLVIAFVPGISTALPHAFGY
jgi:hypothetical protein